MIYWYKIQDDSPRMLTTMTPFYSLIMYLFKFWFLQDTSQMAIGLGFWKYSLEVYLIFIKSLFF